MAPSRDFWSQDRTTIHQKSGWFGKLPPLQKLCYTLLLLFIICWCFYLGMTYAAAIAPEPDWNIVDDDDWKRIMKEESNEEVIRLTGVDVILLVGADKRPEETKFRTDTIILAFFNWDADELKLLSIPRDTYVQFPGKPTKTKINEAYFYGGLPLLEATIEYTFGIEVDHYAEIDFHGFLELIDALGGVEIDVPVRMYKPTEEINIQKGLQTLNGYDALGFVRFRDLPMGDIDRVANQQAFIRALAAKISKSSIWKAPQLVDIAMKNINTNYSLTDAVTLGTAVLKTDLNNIPMYSLPGNGLYIGAISYWILYKNQTIAMITEITGGEVGDFHIINDGGKGTEKPPAKVEENPEEGLPEEGGEGEPGEGEETPTENEPPAAGGEGEGVTPPAEGQPGPEAIPEEPAIPLSPQPEPTQQTEPPPQPTLPEPSDTGGV